MILSGCFFTSSYQEAKIDTIKYFTKYQNEFDAAKDTVLSKQSVDGVSIKNVNYINFYTSNTRQNISFDYDAQGMLGGQYWGLYYASDNTPWFDERNTDIELTETTVEGCYFWQEPDGNNYYATERISENWFFYYMDYDGNRHHLNWRSE
jgi:hypothetical protein